MSHQKPRGTYKGALAQGIKNAIADRSTVSRWKKRCEKGQQCRKIMSDNDGSNDEAVDNIEAQYTVHFSDSHEPQHSDSMADCEEYIDYNLEVEQSMNSENDEESDEDSEDSEDEESPQSIDDKGDDTNLKHLFNTIMFDASKLSIWEVLCMVMTVTVKYNLSDEVQQIILNLIQVLAGPAFNNLNISKYFMKKYFNPPEKTIIYSFYCSSCNILISESLPKSDLKKVRAATCDKCRKEYTVSLKESNYFMTIDLKYQLQNFLEKKSNRDMIDNYLRIKKNNRTSNVFCDIQDSERYINDDYIQSMEKEKKIVLTLNVNTDGSPQFESGRHSFWPIQCIINDIPKEFRFKYIFLAALWYTKTEPIPDFMNLYLENFVYQIQDLMENGIQIMVNDKCTVTYCFKVFSFPVDSVARPILQNRSQFNGYFGCSWCYLKGSYIERSVRYVSTEDDIDLRTHDKFLEDVKTKEKTITKLPATKKNAKYTWKGVKGPSILSSLSGFDCIWGFPHDYMHGVLLGVTRQLWEHWDTNYFTATGRNIINSRLLQIKPPNEIHRVPRVLSRKKAWKATEWRSWLLFYSVPCLTDILPKEPFNSYKLLVKSVYTLLSTRITEDELLQCELDLLTFLEDCERLYGQSFLTFNVHALFHMPESVRKNGPLWATSAYPFESNIFHMKQDVTGPKGVLSQIANRMLRRNILLNDISVAPDSNAWNFCKEVINKRKEVSSNFIKSDDGALLIKDTRLKFRNDSDTSYNRCIYGSKLYERWIETETKKTDNTFVYLEGDIIGRILNFSLRHNKTYITIQTFTLKPYENLNHIYEIKDNNDKTEIHSIEKIMRKVVYVEVKKLSSTESDEYNKYVCLDPNSIEVQ